MTKAEYLEKIVKADGVDMPVIMMKDPSEEHVFIMGSVGYGMSNEQEIESAHIIEHLTFGGTKKFGKKALQDAASDLGGSINGGTWNDFTIYFAMLPDDSTALGVDLVTDIMFSPLMEEEELISLRGSMIGELGMREGTDFWRAWMSFFQAFYPENGYGYMHPYEARVQSINTLTAEQLRANFHKHYVPENMSFFAGGNFDESALCNLFREAAQAKFRRVASDTKPLRAYSDPVYRHLVTEGDFKTEYLVVGFKAPDSNTPDFYPMKILDYVLAGTPGARIHFRMREEEHLSYGANSTYMRSDGHGVFFIMADVLKGKTDRAHEVMLEELAKMREEGLSPEELERAKKALIGTIRTADGTEKKMFGLQSDYSDSKRLVTPGEIAKQYRAVTADDIARVAKQVIPAEFKPENYASARLIAK